ncbi:MAG: hypothetical protein ABJB16_17475 [Saprospiraceae bacterium]
MTPSLKTYLIVFLTTGILFSLVSMILNYAFENSGFNLLRSLIDIVLYGAMGTLVYYITIVLPKKKTSPK